MRAILAVAVVAGAATLADFIWYGVGVRHTMTAGVVHGALLLTVVGGALGSASGRIGKGLPIGALAGVGGALSYYLLVVLVDSRPYGAAIPGAWVVMWLLLAALEGRWLRAPDRPTWMAIAVRGTTAAVAGGISFALVRNMLWGSPPGGERNYLMQFLLWACAWAPGLLALTWPGAEARMRDRSNDSAASISAADLAARIDRGDALRILDVRSGAEFAAGHVPGAVNIPFNQVLAGVDAVPGSPEEDVFVYCGHGPRAYMAAAALRKRGFRRIVYVSGHFSGWQRAGLRIEQ